MTSERRAVKSLKKRMNRERREGGQRWQERQFLRLFAASILTEIKKKTSVTEYQCGPSGLPCGARPLGPHTHDRCF